MGFETPKLDSVCFQLMWYLARLLCLCGFLWNVWNTTQSYFKYETILKGVEIDVEGGKIQFPAIAICSGKHFKEPITMVTLEDYEDNTFNPNDFVIGVKFKRKRTIGRNQTDPVSLTITDYLSSIILNVVFINYLVILNDIYLADNEEGSLHLSNGKLLLCSTERVGKSWLSKAEGGHL